MGKILTYFQPIPQQSPHNQADGPDIANKLLTLQPLIKYEFPPLPTPISKAILRLFQYHINKNIQGESSKGDPYKPVSKFLNSQKMEPWYYTCNQMTPKTNQVSKSCKYLF